MKMTPLLCGAALSLGSLVVHAATSGWEPPEDCGRPVVQTTWFDSIFNKEKVAEEAKMKACLQRARDREERNMQRHLAEMNNIVNGTRDSCMRAIKKLSSAPSTLAFDYAKPFSFMQGLNGAGVNITEGGYSVKVSGSSVNGLFSVTCYTDNNFAVTNVK